MNQSKSPRRKNILYGCKTRKNKLNIAPHRPPLNSGMDVAFKGSKVWLRPCKREGIKKKKNLGGYDIGPPCN